MLTRLKREGGRGGGGSGRGGGGGGRGDGGDRGDGSGRGRGVERGGRRDRSAKKGGANEVTDVFGEGFRGFSDEDLQGVGGGSAGIPENIENLLGGAKHLDEIGDLLNNAEESGVAGELGRPKIISNEIVKTAQAVERGDRKRKLEEDERELLKKLQRVQEEKDRLELEPNPVNLAAPPRDVEAERQASAPLGEVRLQQRDLVEAMSAAFAQALKVNTQRDVQPGLVNRLTSSKEALEFSGNSLEWLRFKRAFENSTELGDYTDEENVSRLYELLKGDARKAVESLMFTSKSAVEIMGALELLYGGNDRILQKLVESLRKLPRLSSGEMNVITFASHVKNNVTAIQSVGDKGYLSNPDLLYDILRKLPESMIFGYNEFIARTIRVSDLTALAAYLGDQAKIANLAGTARILNSVRRSDSDRRENNRSRRVYAVETRERSPVQRRHRSRSPIKRRDGPRSSTRRRESLTCFYCRGKNHAIDECRDFGSIAFRKRWEWTKREKRCFKCLEAGHNSRDCKASGCRVSGCKYQHHKLLHREPTDEPVPRDSRNHERVNASTSN